MMTHEELKTALMDRCQKSKSFDVRALCNAMIHYIDNTNGHEMPARPDRDSWNGLSRDVQAAAVFYGCVSVVWTENR